MRRLAERVLLEEGYMVLTAGDGASALDVFNGRKEQIDIIVSDVVLPGMNGPEFVRAARIARPDVPVVYVSGHTNATIVQDALREMGTRFIQKPFSRGELA